MVLRSSGNSQLIYNRYNKLSSYSAAVRDDESEAAVEIAYEWWPGRSSSGRFPRVRIPRNTFEAIRERLDAGYEEPAFVGSARSGGFFGLYDDEVLPAFG